MRTYTLARPLGLARPFLIAMLAITLTGQDALPDEAASAHRMLSVSNALVASASRQPPWMKWARNPLTLPVTATLKNVYANTASDVTLTLTQKSVALEGAGYGQAVNSSPLSVDLCARREYTLTLIAEDLISCEIVLSNTPNWTPLGASGRGATPKQYHFLADRSRIPDSTIFVSTNGAYSNSWTLELTEWLPAQWRLEDGSDDPASAPGDGTWVQIGPGKTMESSNAAVSWSVSLGRLRDGSAAGRLSLRQNCLDAGIYRPGALYYAASSPVVREQVQLVPVSPGSAVLRQVMAEQAFVDIRDSTTATELRFFFPSQIGTQTSELGHYTNITGNPFVTWMITNPTPSTVRSLHLVEYRNGTASTNVLAFDPDNTNSTWTLSCGKGAEQRLETRGVMFATGASTNRIETVDIRYAGAATPAYRATETYQKFTWGFELVETAVDPDANPVTPDALVTAMTYYTNAADEVPYGKLATITYPDGKWEQRVYAFHDTYPLAVFRPFGDTPTVPGTNEATCQVTVYAGDGHVRTYAPPYDFDDPSTIIDHEVNGRWTQAVTECIGNSTLRYFYDPAVGLPHNAAGFCMLGEYLWLPPLDAGFGFAGHPLAKQGTEGWSEVYYYNAVTYNPVDGSYAVHTDQEPGAGPDWRQCIIYTGFDPQGVLGFPDENDDVYEVLTADGQYLFDPVDFGWASPWVVLRQSWRDAFIYHNGSLVRREKHVLSGVAGNEPEFELLCWWSYQNDSLGHATNITWRDGKTSAQKVVYTADYRGTQSFDGELKLWEADETGIKTVYTYDSLKRIVAQRKEGVASGGGFPAQEDVFSGTAYDAYGRIVGQTNAAGSLSLVSTKTFDLAGRTTRQSSPEGLTTTVSYDVENRRTTRTLPSGATEVRETSRDGRLKSVTGTGVVNEFHSWQRIEETEDDPFSIGIGLVDTVHFGSANSARVELRGYDWANRQVLTRTPDFEGNTCITEYLRYQPAQGALLEGHYRSSRVDETSGEEVAVQMLNYDMVGGNTNAWLQFSQSVGSGMWPGWFPVLYQEGGSGRLSRAAHRFVQLDDAWFRATTNMVYRLSGDSTPTVVGVTLERLSGFASGSTLSEVRQWDADTNLTTITVSLDRNAKKVTETTDVPTSTLDATRITINGLLQSETTPSVAQPVRYAYDALGRQVAVTNSLGFASTTTYNSVGQVATKSDSSGLITSYEYYTNEVSGAGQLKATTSPGGKKTYHAYTTRGEPYRTWGDTPYPEERAYSSYGELLALYTFQNGTGWNAPTWPTAPGASNQTIWTYDGPSGLLASKTDHLNLAVVYSYSKGLLSTRTWARGVTATNYYNGLGELLGTAYSDGTPPFAFTNNAVADFNRSGLPDVLVDATGAWEYYYDYAGRLVKLSCVSGDCTGLTLTNHFNPLYGRDWLGILDQASTAIYQAGYTYDTYGRLATVSSGNYSATYGYLAHSDLLQTTTCRSNTTTALTTTRVWEAGPRLRDIQNVAGSAPVTSHRYLYDALNRRTQATLEDGSRWRYDYDDRDELITGKRSWADWTPVAGQQFEYAFDNLGNRTTARCGGDANGANLRPSDYTANALNQYTSITTLGYKHILGVALATNTVRLTNTVTGTWVEADRKGEYFHGELAIANGSGPLWQALAVGSGGSVSNGGCVFPDNQQALTYDLDGNLSFDGTWAYEWDAENRLRAMSMTNVTGIANANRLRLEFAYDYQSRRVAKTVKSWNGSSFGNAVTQRFVYDGWNLLAILGPQSSILNAFLWGQDLSGTLDGAGGIGGLLGVFEISNGQISDCHFAGYDGNGNVTALVSAGSGQTTARYEYSPFGETLRATGPMANPNPLRFSTKFTDNETGLGYYGYRYYSTGLGRWVSRDPIAEEGGANLYAFVLNAPLRNIDPLGRSTGTLEDTEAATAYGEDMEGGGAVQAARTLNRFRELKERWDDMQQFTHDLMQAAHGDSIDLYVTLLQGAANVMSRGAAKKARVGTTGLEGHHIFPEAFKKQFQDAGIDINQWVKNLSQTTHRGLHAAGGRGGAWNRNWEQFLDANRGLSGDPLKKKMYEQAIDMMQRFRIF